MNKWILPCLGIANWRFRTLGPSVYDPDTLSTVIDRFSRNGAMAPNDLIKIANQLLDVQLDQVNEDWGNIPFAYTLAMVANGKELVNFEPTFALMQDALIAADPNAAPTGANDNTGNSPNSAVKDTIRKQMIKTLDGLISRVEDLESQLALAEAA